MLCPYCLSEVQFDLTDSAGPSLSDAAAPATLGRAVKSPKPNVSRRYRCPAQECRQTIPSMYVQDYNQYPPVVTCAVGFPRHGKTVYFASLFHSLFDEQLKKNWPKFVPLALDHDSLRTVHHNMEMVQRGQLPEATPKNFPRPTLLRLAHIPGLRNGTLCLYDTSGESFTDPRSVQEFARFVTRAHTVLFLISIPQLIDEYANFARGLDQLLNTYIIGLRELGGDPRNQDLVVVYTKADVLSAHLTDWKNLQAYVSTDPFSGLQNMAHYLAIMGQISDNLGRFTEIGMRAANFLGTARDQFHDVRFCLISSLGAAPNADSNELDVQIAPRRVLDPLLLLMQHRRPMRPATTVSPPGLFDRLRRFFGL